MRNFISCLMGFIIGCVCAFLIFSMLFTHPLDAGMVAITALLMVPVGLAAFVLSWLRPLKWGEHALACALPAVLMCVGLELFLIAEGRFEKSWVIIALSMLAVCLSMGMIGHKLAQHKRGDV